MKTLKKNVKNETNGKRSGCVVAQHTMTPREHHQMARKHSEGKMFKKIVWCGNKSQKSRPYLQFTNSNLGKKQLY